MIKQLKQAAADLSHMAAPYLYICLPIKLATVYLHTLCHIHCVIAICHRVSCLCHAHVVAWPSGLRRWFKAPVSSEAWVRIPPLPNTFLLLTNFYKMHGWRTRTFYAAI